MIFRFMEIMKVLDVKKALRQCGWELVEVDGRISVYRHPDVPERITLMGYGNEIVASNLLLIVEHQLGICLNSVLA